MKINKWKMALLVWSAMFPYSTAVSYGLSQLPFTAHWPVDGEQSKPSFATYPIAGLDGLLSNGVVIPFADGHTRQLPVSSKGPFHYTTSADTYLRPNSN